MNDSLFVVLMACAAAGLLGGIAWLYVKKIRPFRAYWRAYHAEVSQCGCLPPTPVPENNGWIHRLARSLVWFQVGKVRFVHTENAYPPGPRVITPNHASAADPLIMGMQFHDEPMRYMAAKGVFDFGCGLGALVAGPAGAFSADLTPGKGSPAKDAAVRALVEGQSVTMFPEGWAWLDGEMGPLKKGAVRIAKEAAQKLGKTVYLVPTYMRYGTHPGSWIRKLPPPVQYLLVFLLAPIYRRGCTIVFGKPIASHELPADDREGIEMLRQAIVAADPGSERARQLLHERVK